MLPNPNFLVSEVELPELPDGQETEKSNFLRKDKKGYPGFLIYFSLGNSTSLTVKLGLGNIGHMDFWSYDRLSGAVQAHTLKLYNS